MGQRYKSGNDVQCGPRGRGLRDRVRSGGPVDHRRNREAAREGGAVFVHRDFGRERIRAETLSGVEENEAGSVPEAGGAGRWITVAAF